MSKSKDLLGKASISAKAAREIAEKAIGEGREMSADERSRFDTKFAEAKKFKEDADAAAGDENLLTQVKSLSEQLGIVVAGPEALPGDKPGNHGSKSLGARVVAAKQFKDLMATFPNGKIPEKARVQSDPILLKSLIVGGSDTSAGAFVVSEQSGIVEMFGRRPLTIRDVISVRRTGSDAVEYVVQTHHTNAAKPVPEATTAAGGKANLETGEITLPDGSGIKPEGSWAFRRETATVKTIAEWVPATKRALADVAALEGLINDELVADLKETEENQIVAGDGLGENLDGILNTSGTQGQAFSTDIFETIRKALTKVRVVGRAVPNGIGLNPSDVERIDLARDNESRFYGAGPFAMGPRTLWGVPIIESEAFPADTGVLGDFRKAVLWDREEATVTFSDSHADFFTRNLVAALAEQREAFAVTRPPAFVITELTA